MKLITCTLLIFTGLSAAAQQKDLFNVEEYLQKNSKLPLLQKELQTSPVIQQDSNKVTLPVQPLSYQLPNQDVVYYGNGTMPCVKPDMSQFKYKYPPSVHQLPYTEGTMPNAALPKKK
ncbi:MAG: hypothetical protein NTW29_18360 [Bacteroidetes bacterium]|nr:hypothetical protein [Bacteroidota bacterium]